MYLCRCKQFLSYGGFVDGEKIVGGFVEIPEQKQVFSKMSPLIVLARSFLVPFMLVNLRKKKVNRGKIRRRKKRLNFFMITIAPVQ